MSKKLTYWGNDGGIKQKAWILSLIGLIVVGGGVLADSISSNGSTDIANDNNDRIYSNSNNYKPTYTRRAERAK